MFALPGKLRDTLSGLAFLAIGLFYARPWPKAVALSTFGTALAFWGWWRAPDVRERRRARYEARLQERQGHDR